MHGIGRIYGATVALAGVDLDLEPGVIGLLGPNGAGKTTLIRLLATALPPTGGEIRVLGRDPQEPAQRTDIRRRLGYLPQEVGFPRGLPPPRSSTTSRCSRSGPAACHAEVRRVLDLVGLSDLATKRIRAMSGGQRHRVALAQKLLGSPLVLILDEPTTGVDPEQRVTLRTVLAEIARTSIVVSSTDQTEDVAALCERVIVLDRGRVSSPAPWIRAGPGPACSAAPNAAMHPPSARKPASKRGFRYLSAGCNGPQTDLSYRSHRSRSPRHPGPNTSAACGP
jgi:ABC-2 type transport system ATP-binding protein